MSTDAATRTTRLHHRAGLVVFVEGSLSLEAQKKAVRALASLATAVLLDEPQEVLMLEHLEAGGLVAAARSR